MNPGFRLRFLATLLVICMLLPLSPVMAASPSDIADHWAEQAIERWIDLGILKGYPDETIQPDGLIKRAEFASLVNRTFGFAKAEPAGFLDVEEDDWFKEDLDKAKTARYLMGYPDNTVKPEDFITRQEAAVIFARLLDLRYSDGGDLFTDDPEIPGMEPAGHHGVRPARVAQRDCLDGSFKPEANMTRAEVVTVLDRLFAEVCNQPGVYGTATVTELNASVVVTSADVTP